MSSLIVRRVAYIKLLIENAKWVIAPHAAEPAVILCPHCERGFELASCMRGEIVQYGMFDDIVIELYQCPCCVRGVALVQTIPPATDEEA